MARVLIAEWSTVPPSDRASAVARWRERRANLSAAGCHFWVYEDATSPGTFVEFTEARDAATLAAARRRAGHSAPDESILTEVELN